MISANFIPRLYLRLKKSYGLDVRALSLMRIFIAMVLLIDLGIRFSSLQALYSEAGAFPFSMMQAYWKPGYFSLFQLSDQYPFVFGVFVVTACVYGFVLVGYKTRIFTFLAWFLLTSLQNRNTLVLQGGDDLLRMILGWGIFLPWGNFYSLDSKKKGMQQVSVCKKTIFSMASFGYLILLFSVYFFTGLLKNSPEWTQDGTALYYALNIDQITWPLGKMLLPHTRLLKFLTLFIRWFELLIPFILLIPYKNKWFRMLFITGIAALHLSICMTLYVGLFYLIGLSSLIGLMPSGVMDRFDQIVRRKHPQAIHPFSFRKQLDHYYFHVLKNSFLFFCIAFCFIWNISTADGSGISIAPRFLPFGYGLRLDQNWGMFAPTVYKDDGWFILEAIGKDSVRVDINRNGSKVTYAKPQNVMGYIKDDRWRKFFENYISNCNVFIRSPYCQYKLAEWNTHHPEAKISSLQVIFMRESTVPLGQKQEAKKEILCHCHF